MSDARPVVLVGSGPVLAIARASARAGSSAVELPPERISGAELAKLAGRAPADVDLFAAVGLHALNHARSDLVAGIRAARFRLTTIVHERAIVATAARMGANVLVAAGASIGPDCEIGEGCVVLDGARIEAGARIGDYAWIGANVVVGFGASVGVHSILRPGVNLDAGVSVGHHCELSTPGLRQSAIPDGAFETAAFAHARVYGGGAR